MDLKNLQDYVGKEGFFWDTVNSGQETNFVVGVLDYVKVEKHDLSFVKKGNSYCYTDFCLFANVNLKSVKNDNEKQKKE